MLDTRGRAELVLDALVVLDALFQSRSGVGPAEKISAQEAVDFSSSVESSSVDVPFGWRGRHVDNDNG